MVAHSVERHQAAVHVARPRAAPLRHRTKLSEQVRAAECVPAPIVCEVAGVAVMHGPARRLRSRGELREYALVHRSRAAPGVDQQVRVTRVRCAVQPVQAPLHAQSRFIEMNHASLR